MSQWARFRPRAWELTKWLVGISTRSGSRWGIFAFFLAISFFLCEGSGMLEQLFPYNSVWRGVAFGVGIFFFTIAVALGVLWLVRGSKDTTAEELSKIGKELKGIKDRLPKKRKRGDNQE